MDDWDDRKNPGSRKCASSQWYGLLTTAYQSSQYSKQTDIDRLKMELELLQLFLGLLFSIHNNGVVELFVASFLVP
ncbi:hypothetical protein CDAR_277711 [Caerostris darwini]|uniref:Uncharacterized protein n=1 Tax=Caerostris darwini TaxID=1538125 RepID=A0AAV4RN46_9ARAC|nr:hypothetical protein CDAR_277711 [Caerostris darwini]